MGACEMSLRNITALCQLCRNPLRLATIDYGDPGHLRITAMPCESCMRAKHEQGWGEAAAYALERIGYSSVIDKLNKE